MRTDNPVRDAERYYNDLDARLERRPVCDKCHEHIQDEYAYEVEPGSYYCWDCARDWLDDFRVSVEKMMEWYEP